jgi:HSP20 family protein
MLTLRLAEKSFGGSHGSASKFLEQIHAKGFYGFFANESWTPNVNLYETDAGYLVCVDLSGVDKEKIELEAVDGRLTIRGTRPVPVCEESPGEAQNTRVRIHLMEIDHGAFARDVELPENVRHDQIVARYSNGMLWIELPKKG